MKKLLSILLIVGFLAGGVFLGYATQPSQYKVNVGDARWHTKLNAGLDALWGNVTDFATLINNWAIEDQIVTLVPVACTYSDNNTFTLPGNYTSRFAAGAVVQIQVATGMVYSTVASSSYAAPTTTVNLNDTVLTNPITRVYVVATRDGLWPNGPGYIVARDYGTDRAALVAADGIAAAAGKELRITYPFPIDDDVTLAAPKVSFTPEAILPISTTKTLTINSTLDAGLYQIFSCTGTGKVVFGAGLVKEVYPEWWAVNTSPGTTDMTLAILAAAASLDTSGGGTVSFQNNTYAVTRIDNFVYNNIKFQGNNREKSIIITTDIGAVAGNKGILYAFDCDGLTFENLTFDGGAEAIDYVNGYFYSHTIRTHACNNVTIRNCIFQNTASNAIDIQGYGNTGSSATNITIEGCLFRNLWHGGIGIGAGTLVSALANPVSNVVIRNNVMVNTSMAGMDWNPILLTNPSEVDISHNYIRHTTAPLGGTQTLCAHIHLHGGYNINISDNDLISDVACIYEGIMLLDIVTLDMPLNRGNHNINIINNRITGGWNYGVNIYGEGADPLTSNDDININGNTIDVRSQGIWLHGYMNRVSIANNIIKLQRVGVPAGFDAAAIYITPDDIVSAITTGVPKNINITGNIFQAYAYSTDSWANTAIAIRGATVADMTNFSVTGNTFISFPFAVYINAYLNTLLMTGNICRDGLVTCYNDSANALNVIHNNNVITNHTTSVSVLDHIYYEAATPVAAVAPSFIGQNLLLKNGAVYSWWRSTGITNADWLQVSN